MQLAFVLLLCGLAAGTLGQSFSSSSSFSSSVPGYKPLSYTYTSGNAVASATAAGATPLIYQQQQVPYQRTRREADILAARATKIHGAPPTRFGRSFASSFSSSTPGLPPTTYTYTSGNAQAVAATAQPVRPAYYVYPQQPVPVRPARQLPPHSDAAQQIFQRDPPRGLEPLPAANPQAHQAPDTIRHRAIRLHDSYGPPGPGDALPQVFFAPPPPPPPAPQPFYVLPGPGDAGSDAGSEALAAPAAPPPPPPPPQEYGPPAPGDAGASAGAEALAAPPAPPPVPSTPLVYALPAPGFSGASAGAEALAAPPAPPPIPTPPLVYAPPGPGDAGSSAGAEALAAPPAPLPPLPPLVYAPPGPGDAGASAGAEALAAPAPPAPSPIPPLVYSPPGPGEAGASAGAEALAAPPAPSQEYGPPAFAPPPPPPPPRAPHKVYGLPEDNNGEGGDNSNIFEGAPPAPQQTYGLPTRQVRTRFLNDNPDSLVFVPAFPGSLNDPGLPPTALNNPGRFTPPDGALLTAPAAVLQGPAPRGDDAPLNH